MLTKFQSTHSRGVRLIRSFDISQVRVISIHALTRSATTVNKGSTILRYISIHALTRSATWRRFSWYARIAYFNPRTHEECDEQRDGLLLLRIGISIHALTRSATSFDYRNAVASIPFQSTHSRGVRPVVFLNEKGISQFQSTHSRGVRQRNLSLTISALDFNPRTHEECDR